jgi:hypothetical protein
MSMLGEACSEQIELVESVHGAWNHLRNCHYTAVIIDQTLVDNTPHAQELLTEQLGAAFPIYLNFALSGPERIVREVQRALQRNQMELTAAQNAARLNLRHELTGAVTGILLSSEQTLTVRDLPDAARVKLRFIYELANDMKKRLEAHT